MRRGRPISARPNCQYASHAHRKAGISFLVCAPSNNIPFLDYRPWTVGHPRCSGLTHDATTPVSCSFHTSSFASFHPPVFPFVFPINLFFAFYVHFTFESNNVIKSLQHPLEAITPCVCISPKLTVTADCLLTGIDRPIPAFQGAKEVWAMGQNGVPAVPYGVHTIVSSTKKRALVVDVTPSTHGAGRIVLPKWLSTMPSFFALEPLPPSIPQILYT